jgi:hypothetical protein
MLTEEQHENLRKADLCACDECHEDRAIDGTIDRLLTNASAQPEQIEAPQ